MINISDDKKTITNLKHRRIQIDNESFPFDVIPEEYLFTKTEIKKKIKVQNP